MAVTDLTDVGEPGAAAAWQAPTWIYGPPADALLILGWIPLFVLGVLATEGADPAALARLVAVALFASALHQPLTLGLVYGDASQRSAHAALFRWAPLVVVAVVLAATWYVPLVVIPVAAIWNTIHTVQQRYGVCRIYGRKTDHGAPRLDRALLYTSLATVIAVVTARGGLVELVAQADLGGRNGDAVRQLSAFADPARWLAAPLLVGTIVLGALWWHRERAGRAPNPARVLYMASSLALVTSIVVNPAAGFVAYLGAHTIEYLVVVERTAERRGADPQTRGAVAWTRGRPLGVAVAMVVVMAPVALAHVVLPLRALSVVLACVGALHFLYDGVIWKLRRPTVAREFALTTAR